MVKDILHFLGLRKIILDNEDNITLLSIVVERFYKKLLILSEDVPEEEKEKIKNLHYNTISLQLIQGKYPRVRGLEEEDGKVKVKHLFSVNKEKVEKIQELVKVYNILKHLQEIEKLL